jgi:hypothetical protein
MCDSTIRSFPIQFGSLSSPSSRAHERYLKGYCSCIMIRCFSRDREAGLRGGPTPETGYDRLRRFTIDCTGFSQQIMRSLSVSVSRSDRCALAWVSESRTNRRSLNLRIERILRQSPQEFMRQLVQSRLRVLNPMTHTPEGPGI